MLYKDNHRIKHSKAETKEEKALLCSDPRLGLVAATSEAIAFMRTKVDEWCENNSTAEFSATDIVGKEWKEWKDTELDGLCEHLWNHYRRGNQNPKDEALLLAHDCIQKALPKLLETVLHEHPMRGFVNDQESGKYRWIDYLTPKIMQMDRQ